MKTNNIFLKYQNLGIKTDESIAKYTTVKLGGNADYFLPLREILSQEQYTDLIGSSTIDDLKKSIKNTSFPFQDVIKVAIEAGIPYYMLGGGSDVLFSDNPFHGIIIKMLANKVFFLPNFSEQNISKTILHPTVSRHVKVHSSEPKKDLSFDDLYFEENKSQPVYLYAEAGVMIPFLIQYTLTRNISGMHWFSHIPASIGGAIFNNIHGGKIMFSEYVSSVIILNKDREIQIISHDEMDFSYDNSRIQHTKDIVLGVILKLYQQTDDEIQSARVFSDTWIQQKSIVQPKNYSVGSTFKNISDSDRIRLNLPTNSAGYLIDNVGLKGYTIGNAQIYETHGNFFLNKGGATASDYKALIDLTVKKVHERYGITLEPEVKIVNF